MVRRPAAGVEDEPGGLFPSWGWLYAVVVVYGVLVIAALLVLSQLLDPGSP